MREQHRIKELNVLSDFDGISTAQLVLKQLGIEVNYFASEINEDAIKVTKHHFPDTIHLGDVREVNTKKLPKIDLLVGGSPCQGFSIAGRKLNFEDERSKLFFEFVKHKKQLKPTYFFYENVRITDMNVYSIISEMLGVQPICVNSKWFTGQSRKRMYWTNLPFSGYPTIHTKNMKSAIDLSIPFDKSTDKLLSKTVYSYRKGLTSNDGLITINPRTNEDRQTWQRGRIYDIGGYSPAICKSLWDYWITNDDHNFCRKLTIEEVCKLQGFPSDYLNVDGVTRSKKGEMLGDAWTVPVITSFFNSIK